LDLLLPVYNRASRSSHSAVAVFIFHPDDTLPLTSYIYMPSRYKTDKVSGAF